MVAGLTAKQFQEWEYYATLEPFGAFREDYRNAYIVQMIHNVNVAKEHQKPLKDFLLKFDDDNEPEVPQAEDAGVVELKVQEVFLQTVFGNVPAELQAEIAARAGYDPMPNVVE